MADLPPGWGKLTSQQQEWVDRLAALKPRSTRESVLIHVRGCQMCQALAVWREVSHG